MALTINRTPITPKPLVFNTVSGPIASCNNASDGKAKRVLCSINPVQSGSGDPSPHGSNIFDPSTVVYKQRYYRDDNGTEQSSSASGYTTSKTEASANTTYIMDGFYSSSDDDTYCRIYYLQADDTWIGRSEGFYIIDQPYEFTTPANCKYLQFQIPIYNTSFANAKVYTKEGNTRPITGFTGLDLERAKYYHRCVPTQYSVGDVVYSGNGITVTYTEHGKYHIEGTATGEFISTIIRIDEFTTQPTTESGRLFRINNSANASQVSLYLYNGSTRVDDWYLTPAHREASYSGMANKTINGIAVHFKSAVQADLTVMPEFIDTGDGYTTYPITWQSSAGTVYGAELDVTAGKLRVTKKYALLNDPDKWGSTTGNVDFSYSQQFSDRKLYANSYTGLFSSYIIVSANSASNTGRWGNATSVLFGIKSSLLTLAQIKQDAQDGKIAICYELATPIEYDLTPTQVQMLLGTNNLWHGDNGDTEVTYMTN